MTIYKYGLSVDDSQTIHIPKNAKILKVAIQNDVPCLWAMVNPSAALELFHIEMRGTGQAEEYFNEGVLGEYIDTILLLGGTAVFHVFKRKAEDK